jgi:MoxR-like ATPase
MTPPRDDVALFQEIARLREILAESIARVVVGQDGVVELLLVTLFAGGHGLFIGVPGLAKTLLVRTTAAALGLRFSRVQFTPDLMPSDILGTEVLEEDRGTGRRSMRFIEGPVFTNLLLADEVNRTPPKTQAALLQAMAEQAVTLGGATRPLDAPFMVLATQNPIEQEGTYPLPEAQLDRFMFSIRVGYPTEGEEVEIVRRTTASGAPEIAPVLDRQRLLDAQALIRRLPVPEDVLRYAVRLARASRPESGSEVARRWVQWGASPRASQYLALGARVRAALHGNEVPVVEDVRAVARAVLGHRIVLNFEAEASGVDSLAVVDRILNETPAS